MKKTVTLFCIEQTIRITDSRFPASPLRSIGLRLLSFLSEISFSRPPLGANPPKLAPPPTILATPIADFIPLLASGPGVMVASLLLFLLRLLKKFDTGFS